MKKTLLFFTIIAMIAFISCDKDDKYDKGDWGDKDKETCFELVYPVSYTMPDDSSISGENEDAVWSAIKTWYEVNKDEEKKPELEYPVNVLFEDGETVEVDNEDEMTDLKKDCEWKEEWKCFDLVFSVSVTMPDDSIITGEDEEALWTAIKAWYETHPDVEEKMVLQYPVDILFEDGATQTIANEDEMDVAKENCKD